MKKNILIISPHADDEILGCGGFISKYSKQNYQINVVPCQTIDVLINIYFYEVQKVI